MHKCVGHVTEGVGGREKALVLVGEVRGCQASVFPNLDFLNNKSEKITKY
jgi:hypothetical protein